MREFPAADALARMLLVRAVDERLVAVVEDGGLPGTVLHSSRGQEASAVGVALHRRPGDVLFSTHRGIAHCVAWGADLVALLCESLGRRGGNAGGLQGHMHLVDADRGILGTNGIVGGGLPLAVGAAAGLAQLSPGACAVAFLGDGAANTGACQEAFNLAAVWQVPVLFVCENNRLAEMSYSAELTGGTVAGRADAYGIPAEVVDASDVEAVWAAAGRGVVRVRAGHGPALLECLVHRAGGHWVGDPERYRDPDEKAGFAELDPIAKLVATGAVGPAQQVELRERAESRAGTALAAALAAPRPVPEDVIAALP